MAIAPDHKKIIIAGVIPHKTGSEDRLHELESYLKANGGSIVGRVIQKRGVSRSTKPGGSKQMHQPLDPATYIGKGKALELRKLCDETACDLVIFINPLSNSQVKNLEELTFCNVVLASSYLPLNS